MYIHELPEWPNFTWDDKDIINLLSSVRHKQGILLSKINNLGFGLKSEAMLITLTNDVVTSSAIEGETYNPEEVRSSIAQRLGMDVGGLVPTSRDVEGIVEILIDATKNYDAPITAERLFSWHAALFPTGRSGLYKITVGDWRPKETEPMQVVSGPMGRERVHFEAPKAARLAKEMSVFIKWCNKSDIDCVIKAAIAHLWFVTIHPFEDGNGRIGRAISDLFLTRSDGLPDRFYSLSSQIEAERKNYYKCLEESQKGSLNITPWIQWFLQCLQKSLDHADKELSHVIYKATIIKSLKNNGANDRQKKVIIRMLDSFEGSLTTSKYGKIAKCSQDTALRDIKDLMAMHILVQAEGGGRSTKYQLVELDTEKYI